MPPCSPHAGPPARNPPLSGGPSYSPLCPTPGAASKHCPAVNGPVTPWPALSAMVKGVRAGPSPVRGPGLKDAAALRRARCHPSHTKRHRFQLSIQPWPAAQGGGAGAGGQCARPAEPRADTALRALALEQVSRGGDGGRQRGQQGRKAGDGVPTAPAGLWEQRQNRGRGLKSSVEPGGMAEERESGGHPPRAASGA